MPATFLRKPSRMKIGSVAVPLLGAEFSVETRANGQKVLVKRRATSPVTIGDSQLQVIEDTPNEVLKPDLLVELKLRPPRQIRIVSCPNHSSSEMQQQQQQQPPPGYQPFYYNDPSNPPPIPAPMFAYPPPPIPYPQGQPPQGLPEYYFSGQGPVPAPPPAGFTPTQTPYPPETNPPDQSRMITPDDFKYKCSNCGRYRSPAYHHKHPLPPGQLAPPTLCRKCRRRSLDSTEDSDDSPRKDNSRRRRDKHRRDEYGDLQNEANFAYARDLDSYDDDEGIPRRRVRIIKRPRSLSRGSRVSGLPDSPSSIVIKVGGSSRGRRRSIESAYARDINDNVEAEDNWTPRQPIRKRSSSILRRPGSRTRFSRLVNS